MAYDKGKFYHEDDKQVIDNVEIINSTVGGVNILTGTVAPIAANLAPAGSLYVSTETGAVKLYINTGTESVPVWKALAESTI